MGLNSLHSPGQSDRPTIMTVMTLNMAVEAISKTVGRAFGAPRAEK
jgi:hypothetical protein